MAKRQFRENFFCKNCGGIASRVFDAILKENSIEADERIKTDPKVVPFIILDWWCCANQKCRNWFNRLPNLSRCPACHYWSVAFSIQGENKLWKCKKKDCGWYFSIISID